MTEPAPAPPRWLALGLAALTLVAVGGLSLLLFRNDLERLDDPAEAPATVGDDPVLVADDFDRADAPTLADADHPWAQVHGAWAVQDGHGTVTAAPADRPALATLPVDGPSGVVRARATAVEPGWAFAFRVQDEANFVAVVARPEAGGWTLGVVRDGVATESPLALGAAPADGTVIEVRRTASGVQVTLDGGGPQPVDGVPFAEATDVGLATFESANLASMAWDDVEVARS